MSRLALSLLGRFHGAHGDQPLVGWESDKARALLALLVVEPAQPHPRARLADMLWPTLPSKRARRNLSQALYNLRAVLGESADQPPFLLASASTLQWNPQRPYWLDVAAFRQGVEQPDLDATTLMEALDLYRGPLLADVVVGASLLWDEWLSVQREELHRLAVEGSARLADHFAAAQQWEEACHFAQQQVALAPWLESGHRTLMRLLAASGQRSAALRHFERCRAALADELAVAPSAETVALYDALRGAGQQPAAAPALPATAPAPPNTLPPQRSSFVGRSAELDALEAQLRDPACRLLTLLGIGGVGKTRLSQQLAHRLADAFPDGLFWVPLESLHNSELLAATVLQALPVEALTRDDATTQLQRWLRERRCLLLLDNMEQLRAGAAPLSAWLAAAPGLKIVLSSRIALGLPDEWAWTLEGLPAPPPGTPLAELGGWEAVQLWAQRAAQARGGWKLTPANAEAVARITAAVEGLPLAIELAAAWVRLMPTAAIADDLARLTAEAEATLQALPARQRGMAALFEHSWALLGTEEQRTFRALAHFEGGFTRAAAMAVADCSASTLLALAYASLLRMEPGGRYSLHPLLREFAAHKLAAHPDEAAHVAARHSDFYARWAAEQRASILQAAAGQVARIGAEVPNVRAAWQWAASSGQSEVWLEGLPTLAHFFTTRGPFQEGERFFGELAARLSPNGQPQGSRAALQAQQATFLNMSGRYEAADALAQAILAQPALDEQIQAHAWLERGLSHVTRGNHEPARAHLSRALDIAEQSGADEIAASALRLLGVTASNQGRMEEALTIYQRALTLCEQLGDQTGMAGSLNNLGLVYKNMGQLGEARRRYERAQQLFAALGNQRGQSFVLNNLGVIARSQGEFAAARDAFQQSLRLKRALGDQRGEAYTLTNLGTVSAALGQYASARLYFERVLALNRTLGQQREEAIALSNLAQLRHLMGEDRRALQEAEAGLALARTLADQETQGFALTHLGHARLALGQAAAAAAAYREAVALRERMGAQHLTSESQAGLIRAMMAQGHHAEAHTLAQALLPQIAEEHSLDGSEEPLRTLLTVARALHPHEAACAQALLARAHASLQQRAASLPEAMRGTFLQAVATHRAILAAVEDGKIAAG